MEESKTRPPPVGVGEYLPYHLDDWEQDCVRTFAFGRDPEPCPACSRTGFYGPRFYEPERRYRSCRFCGFWQDVGGQPVRARPTVHDCDGWPHCARAPYIWWVEPGRATYACPFCQDRVVISRATVCVPVDDPEHPWWKVPQRRPRDYYERFWENWSPTRGRIYL